MDADLTTLQADFERLCARLGTPRRLNTTAGHDGCAHIEVVNGQYHYVCTERGLELHRRHTRSKDEALYWLLSDLTFGLAVDDEYKHRVKGRSFRRLLFAKQLQLLQSIEPAWAARKAEEIHQILLKHPYDDLVEG